MATARQLQRLMDSMEPSLLRAFLDSIQGVTSRAAIAELEAAVEAFDVERALRAAGVRDYSFSELAEAIRENYRIAGDYIVAADVPARFGFAFNMTNPRVQQYLSQHSGNLITEFGVESRQAIRNVMSAGFDAGQNPRTTALDIAGRVGRNGRRSGGVVGLNRPQAGAVINAKDELRNLDSNYFSRKRRDRRFDAMVRRAIESGEPLTADTINRITGRYSDRLLNLRGETIARTEALNALNEANDEAMRQVVQEGLAEEGAVRRVWDASGDSRTRADHAVADGQERGLNEPFLVGGFSMMRPGDGPASQVVNCRCVIRNQVDFSKTAL